MAHTTLPGSPQGSFQRARSAAQKQQRVDAILAAGRHQLGRDGVLPVSLGTMAAEVGLHKSAILRYFETREDVFLQITAQEWQDWAREVDAAVTPATHSASVLASILARTLAGRTLFCELLAHVPFAFEPRVSADAVAGFRGRVRAASGIISTAVARVLPRLDAPELDDLVVAATSLAPSLRASDAFEERLERLLMVFLLGLIDESAAGGRG